MASELAQSSAKRTDGPCMDSDATPIGKSYHSSSVDPNAVFPRNRIGYGVAANQIWPCKLASSNRTEMPYPATGDISQERLIVLCSWHTLYLIVISAIPVQSSAVKSIYTVCMGAQTIILFQPTHGLIEACIWKIKIPFEMQLLTRLNEGIILINSRVYVNRFFAAFDNWWFVWVSAVRQVVNLREQRIDIQHKCFRVLGQFGKEAKYDQVNDANDNIAVDFQTSKSRPSNGGVDFKGHPAFRINGRMSIFIRGMTLFMYSPERIV